MKTAIISGSHRAESQSAKVAKYISSRLSHLSLSEDSYILELASKPVDFWNGDSHLTTEWAKHYGEIKNCDSYVIISPEWDGMVPPALKNFFHMFTRGEFAHKPALLVSVSAGINGAYPIVELRMSSYKNTRICYLPEHIIVRYVENVLNEADPEEMTKEENRLRDRIDYALGLLGAYSKALGEVRESFDLRLKEFRNGL